MRAHRLLLVLALLVAPPATASAHEGAVEAALAFLASGQSASGGFATEATYVVEALAAAGREPKSWPTPDASAFAALREYGLDDVGRYNARVRIAYAASVAGYDARDVHGVDYVAAVREGFTGAQFGSPAYINDDAWAILALRAAGVPASDPHIRAAVTVLESAQRVDGGWSHLAAAPSASTDVSGMVLAALRSAGEDMRRFASAKGYLDATRVPAAGHSDAPGGGANCQSTAWALHGYAALGVPAGAGVADWLVGQQRADGGFAISSGNSNAFCTAEAVVAVAGVRHPLPAFKAASVSKPTCHAREPCTLRVSTPFARLDVAWEDGATGSTRAFDAAGAYAFRYHASGAGVHARGEGVLDVLSARPVVGALPANVTLHRHAPLTLDLRNASDVDGAVVAFEIDWGDGTGVTHVTTHAYPLPGEYEVRVRARDDAGAWSDPAGMTVIVENRAPVLALPERIVADRVRAVELAPQASDPDGDAVALAWRFGDAHGEGAPAFVPSELGERTLTLTATDAFGGEARAHVVVAVRNIPPSIALVPGDELRAEASDEDGPDPVVTWLVDGMPASPPIRLAPGTRTIVATATDADGATANATATIVVPDADAPAEERPLVAPSVDSFEARLEEGALRINFLASPPEAIARIVWRSDAGEGEAAAVSPFERPLPGASWASAILLVEHDGIQVTRDTGLLLPVAAPVAAREETAPPAPVVVEAQPMRPAAEPPAPRGDATLEPASVRPQEERRPVPAAPWLLAALAAAMLGRRARSA